MLHTPVLLNEVIKLLNPQAGDFVIDGTVDGGGHAAAILERIMPSGKFLGLDLDTEILKSAKKRLAAIANSQSPISKKIFLANGSYANLPEIMREQKLPKADCLLLDLGFSSEQLESSGGGNGRGFSFQRDEPLIMTYDNKRQPVREILKIATEKELTKIISEFGGERFAKMIARAIVERERIRPIETSAELAEVVRATAPKNYERGRIDPATRTFQALRIYANGELENLRKLLGCLGKIIRPGGRAAIISFHSLEDRIVKEDFRREEKAGKLKILTKKPIGPSAEEIKANHRSRSAKLRAAMLII